MKRNILLLILVLSINFATASYFGAWYDKISPQYGDWIYDKNDEIIFSGFILSFIFFTPLIFGLFGFKKNIIWISILLAPVLLFWFFADTYYIYVPIVLVTLALVISKTLNLIFVKFFNRSI